MLTVVKLGGSLYRSPLLKNWLQTFVQLAETRPLLIVPGGGPFADCVRDAQRDHDLSDKTAHQMAINAMRQFALLLLDLQPDARPLTQSAKPAHQMGLSIWLPDDDAMMTTDLPQNWQVTSDTLALWLAQQHDAGQLWLIKCCEIADPALSTLAANGIVDPHFIRQYQQQPLPCSIVRHTDYANCLTRQIAVQ